MPSSTGWNTIPTPTSSLCSRTEPLRTIPSELLTELLTISWSSSMVSDMFPKGSHCSSSRASVTQSSVDRVWTWRRRAAKYYAGARMPFIACMRYLLRRTHRALRWALLDQSLEAMSFCFIRIHSLSSPMCSFAAPLFCFPAVFDFALATVSMMAMGPCGASLRPM